MTVVKCSTQKSKPYKSTGFELKHQCYDPFIKNSDTLLFR
jgi:hypothetical protein